MKKSSVSRVVTATPSQHKLSVGPLRERPLGSYDVEQLESASTLVDLEREKALAEGDEQRLSRLAVDEREVADELERRSLGVAP